MSHCRRERYTRPAGTSIYQPRQQPESPDSTSEAGMTAQPDPYINVAAYLTAAAANRPHALAVVCPSGTNNGRVRYTHLTYAQLDVESGRLALGMERLGIRRGTRTVLMVPPSLDFFALTFALFKLGAVLVLVDPGMGVQHLGRCLSEAEPEAFIGVGKAHAARHILGWARRTVRITVGPGGRHSLRQVRKLGANSSFPCAEVAADEMAAVLFTSGSTGIAKGAVYTHGTFATQVDAIRRLFDIRPGEIDLATFPLFALFAPALGMTAVIPDMDPTRPAKADPRKIVRAVEDWGVTNLFGSPALIDVLGRYGQTHGIRLPSLRRVISAGAPVPAATIERMTAMLAPAVEVFTPYGATECLPVACIGSREILADTRHTTATGGGICVGRPVRDIEVAIIGVTDDEIPAWDDALRLRAGDIGEIVVRGPFATRSYYGRPSATTLAKIVASDGSIWHRMGDVGYFDAVERLWFCGRKAHRVTTHAGVLFTIQVEGVFNSHPAVFRSALVGVGPPTRQQPVICVELETKARGIKRKTLFAELAEYASRRELTSGIRRFLVHPGFPVDVRHNAKIDRESLAVWAANQP